AIAGGAISARFLSDPSNVDSDLLVVSFAELGGGNAQVDRQVAAPGGTATVSLSAPSAGTLEVWVSIGHDADGGRLTVSRDGATVDDEPVRGSVRWVYAVENP